MKKLFLATLFLVPALASAEPPRWEYVAATDEQKIYLDINSVKRNGEIVGMWVVNDFNSQQDHGGTPYKSAVMLEEHNCRSDERRIRKMMYYADGMGRGKIVFNPGNNPSLEWNANVPGSVAQDVNRVACKMSAKKPAARNG